MASRYWIGSGIWNTTNTANWSATSGGATGASVPTSSDDVFFNAASGSGINCFIDASVQCNNIDFTGSDTLLLSDSSPLMVFGSFTWNTNVLNTYSGTITFAGTGSNSITTGGRAFDGPIVIDGVGGTYTVVGSLSTNSSITVTHGTFNTNGQTISCSSFNSNNSNTRGVTLGSSTITCSNTSTPWNFATSTNLTFSGASSTIILSGVSGTFAGGGLTYGTVNFTNGTATKFMTGANSFTNLSVVNGAGNSGLSLDSSINIGSTFTATGQNIATHRLLIEATNQGVPLTIAAASVSLTNVDFADIAATGAATWSGTSIGNALGNSGITFTTTVTRYWVSNAGSWSGSHWATTTGGSPGASVPLCHDSVIFDASSFNTGGQTVTMDTRRACANMTWTGVTNSPTANATLNVSIFGNVVLASVTLTGTGLNFTGRSTQTFTQASATIQVPLNFIAVNGSYTLQDALVSSANMEHEAGLLDFNNKNVTCQSFVLINAVSASPAQVNLGSGTLTLTGLFSSSFPWLYFSGTVVAGTSTIKMTDSTSSNKTFAGGGNTYYNVWLSGTGSGDFIITGNNTFNNFRIDPALAVQFTSGSSTTVSSFTATGTAGNEITIGSTSAATHSLVKVGGGNIFCDYLILSYSTATPSNTWYAGAHSTDNGNNSGWIFNAPPSNSMFQVIGSIIGNEYEITATTGGSTGFITVNLGGVSANIAAGTIAGTVNLVAAGDTLSIVGSPTFNGTVDTVSVRQVFNRILLVVYEGETQATLYYYDSNSWNATNLTALSNDVRNRFTTLGGFEFITNQTDGMYSSDDGIIWASGSAANCIPAVDATPSLIYRYKNRLLAAGDPTVPDRVYFSSIIDPQSSPFITWNTTDGTGDYIDVNPDDGGNITGFSENSTFLLVFKDTGMYRMDTVSKTVDPDNIFNVGAVSQEAITLCMGVTYYFSGNGIYRTNGGYPEQISRAAVQDIINAMSPADWEHVTSGTDGLNVYFSMGDIILHKNQTNQRTIINCWIKFSPRDQSWSVHAYGDFFKFFSQYTDGNGALLRSASDAGTVQTINLGQTDGTHPIPFFLETQDIEFGGRGHLKGLSDKFIVFTDNGLASKIGARINGRNEVEPIEMPLDGRVNVGQDVNIQGNFFNFYWSGVSTGNPPILEGIGSEHVMDQGLDGTKGLSGAPSLPRNLLS